MSVRMNKRKIEKKWNNASIQTKMMTSFFFPIILILVVNTYMYTNINAMIVRVDEIYTSNVTLNNLSAELTQVQSSVREYLENKGSSALNDYYMAEQNYRNLMNDIHEDITIGSQKIMQENIYNQSEVYLEQIGEIVQAKRGRNVEKYKSGYEEAQVIYADLQTCIHSLNNEQFKSNTKNYNVLLSSLKYMELVTITILLIVGLVNLVVLFLITRSMAKPLRQLSHAANEVADGNFDVQIEILDASDEIGVMSKAFNKMVDSIQIYIAEIRKSMRRESALKERELVMASRMKEVQLRSLQAQINPHFLFNTLNAGAQLAMMEGADKTTEFIQVMADFFRYNIKKIDSDTTIEEEVALVDRYIYILNVRFTGEIHFSKHVDSEVGNVRVPSMVLQPIVENAVNYGIRNIEWEGHIDLKIYKQNDMVYMSIKDNGIGMSQDTIDMILSGEYFVNPDEEKTDSNGVGLGNVIERLQIFTGHKDVMEIISEGEGKGTEFIIKVPMHV